MFNPFERKPKVEVKHEGQDAIVDPTTGAVIGTAKTQEEIKAMIRRNAEEQREAA